MTAGVDRTTGRLLIGWDHVVQSIEVIISTPIGQRLMREWVGSPVPQLLGRNMTPTTFMRFVQAIVVAVELYEPRFKVRRATVTGSPEQIRSGQVALELFGDYRPFALIGDFRVEGMRNLKISPDSLSLSNGYPTT